MTIVLSVASLPVAVLHADELDEADKAFFAFFDEPIVSYDRTELYDSSLSGYDYRFETEDGYGFALMACLFYKGNEFFEVEEVYFDKSSPFVDIDVPIYLTPLKYLEYHQTKKDLYSS